MTAVQVLRGRLGRGIVAAAILAGVTWVVLWSVSEHQEDDQRFHVVRRGVLYRSRQPELGNLADLQRRNIVQVVNLREESEDEESFARVQAACAAQGVKVVNIPVSTVIPDDGQIRQFLQAVTDCKGATLVHCAQGRSRTGIMVAAYRVIVEGCPAQAAFDEMVRYGDNPKGEEHAVRLALLNRLADDRRQWLDKLSNGSQ